MLIITVGIPKPMPEPTSPVPHSRQDETSFLDQKTVVPTYSNYLHRFVVMLDSLHQKLSLNETK